MNNQISAAAAKRPCRMLIEQNTRSMSGIYERSSHDTTTVDMSYPLVTSLDLCLYCNHDSTTFVAHMIDIKEATHSLVIVYACC